MQPLPNSRHVELHVVVRDDGVAAVEERGDVALHQRFIDATASRERVCSAQRMLKREAGMEGAREQRGRGWPVYAIQQQIAAFKTERTRRKHVYKPVQAIEHLLTTNLRICQNASNRTSRDSSGRHEAQVRGDDVHAREHTSPAGIGSAAESGGWPAGGEGRARQDKLVQAVLSEHADLGACHGPRQAATSRPHSIAYNSIDERKARTCHNTSMESRLPRLQDSHGDEAPGQPRR